MNTSETQLHPSLPKAPLLVIPLEIREKILYHVFFPYNTRTNGDPHKRSPIRLYPRRGESLDGSNVSVLRTCHQLFNEGEVVLFRCLKINLVSPYPGDNGERQIEFLERLTSRQRRLVRQLDLKCFPSAEKMPLCEWKHLMLFLASECHSLTTLRLWLYPEDEEEEYVIIGSCQKNYEWVRAIQQIQTLREFDIVWHRTFNVDRPQTERFLHWLRSRLLCNTTPTQPSNNETQGTVKPLFLSLPRNVRRLIYRYTILPPNRIVHPCLSRKIDERTTNIIALFLTCRSIHKESEELLYSQAIFSSCYSKYQKQFIKFFYNRNPHQLKLMKTFFCEGFGRLSNQPFHRFLVCLSPEYLGSAVWNVEGWVQLSLLQRGGVGPEGG